MPRLAQPQAPPDAPATRVGLEQLIRGHFGFIWRLLRRLGLPESDADDAAQQVFLIAGAKLATIRAGSERAFLYGCAVHRAAKWQTSRARARRSISWESEPHSELAANGISPEERLDRAKAQRLLDAVLATMPPSLRAVFVLFELDQLSTIEIAELLELPRGTVASRLRRAREDFTKRVKRLERCERARGVGA